MDTEGVFRPKPFDISVPLVNSPNISETIEYVARSMTNNIRLNGNKTLVGGSANEAANAVTGTGWNNETYVAVSYSKSAFQQSKRTHSIPILTTNRSQSLAYATHTRRARRAYHPHHYNFHECNDQQARHWRSTSALEDFQSRTAILRHRWKGAVATIETTAYRWQDLATAHEAARPRPGRCARREVDVGRGRPRGFFDNVMM